MKNFGGNQLKTVVVGIRLVFLLDHLIELASAFLEDGGYLRRNPMLPDIALWHWFKAVTLSFVYFNNPTFSHAQ